MDLLKRKLAPILPDAWKFIDEEAARVLSLNLAGRKVVDFDGPHGFTYAAVNTGRMTMLGTLGDIGPSAGLREVQPLVELRSAMKLDSMELDTVARGGEDPDLAHNLLSTARAPRKAWPARKTTPSSTASPLRTSKASSHRAPTRRS